MHLHQAQPHVSEAVKHVRGWVTILSVLVAVCCLTQMLTYGFVSYTGVRFTDATKVTPLGERSLQVLAPTETEDQAADQKAAASSTTIATGGVRSKAIEKGREVAPPRVRSAMDTAMSRINLFATAAGPLACVMLAVLVLLGTVIAGGANIPGVEKTVTASTWAMVLGLLCVPWASAFPHVRVPGVFAAYRDLCAVADGLPGAASTTTAFFQWIVMPIVAASLSMFVMGLYRVGVERGVIATAPSHFDTAIQREMSDIARRGVAPVGGRAVGVLNRAIGGANPTAVSPAAAPMTPIAPVSAGVVPERPLYRPITGESHVEHALEEAAAVASSLVREAQGTMGVGGGQSVADGKYRRLI